MKKSKRKTTSAKETGGGGHDFEDAVAVSLILSILEDQSPFHEILGSPQELQFQVKTNWHCDDLVLKFADEKKTSVAFTIKSQRVVGTKVAKKVVSDVWNDFNKIDGSPFRRDSDFLAIAAKPGSPTGEDDFHSLLIAARGISSNEFVERNCSLSQRRMLSSICSGQDQNFLGPLLSRIFYLTFDFESSSSKQLHEFRDRIFKLCPKLSDNEAANMENLLFRLVASARKEGLTITREDLFNRLTGFPFVGGPRLLREISIIQKIISSRTSSVSNRIGKLTLSRALMHEAIDRALTEHRAVTILGPSGSGKSAFLKCKIQNENRPVILLDVKQGLVGQIREIEEAIGRTLFQFAAACAQGALVIIDSVEKVGSPSQYQLLENLLCKLIENPRNSFILSCMAVEWPKAAISLMNFYRSTSGIQIEVPLLADSESQAILRNYPQLDEVLAIPTLREIVTNLKSLDYLCRNAEMLGRQDSGATVSELELIDWIWVHLLDRSGRYLGRERVILLIAECQAERNTSSVPDLSIPNELLLDLSSLLDDGLVVRTDEGLDLDHEIIGSWARFMMLKSNCESIRTFLDDRHESVFWSSSIILFGRWVLKKKGLNEWIRILKELREGPNLKESIDSYSESLFLTRNKKDLSSFMTEESGEMLDDLLRRFKFRATVPDWEHIKFLKQIGAGDLLNYSEAMDRSPIVQFWEGLFDVFIANLDATFLKSPKTVMELCYIYLKADKTRHLYQQRVRAAELSLEFARRIYLSRRQNQIYFGDDEVALVAYRNVLLGFPYLRDEGITFLRKLAGLDSEGPQSDPYTDYGQWDDFEDIGPSPNGPISRVDGTLAQLCLEEWALNSVVNCQPQFAKELLLACLLREPGRYRIDREPIHANFGLRSMGKSFYPPLFSKGPFYSFFRFGFAEGLACLKCLVEVASEEWLKLRGERIELAFDEDGREKWWGSWDIYNWSRDQAHAPDFLVCSLMALEKFIEDQLSLNNKIEPYLLQVVEGGGSLAFLAVVLSFIKRDPSLLDGPLGKYIQSENLLWMDREFSNHESLTGAMKMLGWNLGHTDRPLYKMAERFQNASFRNVDLITIAIQRMLSFPRGKFAARVATIREKWITLVRETSDDREKREIDLLVKQFSPELYVQVEVNGIRGLRLNVKPEAKDLELLRSTEFLGRLLGIENAVRGFFERGEEIGAEKLIEYSQLFPELMGNIRSEPDRSIVPDIRTALAAILALFSTSYPRLIEEIANGPTLISDFISETAGILLSTENNRCQRTVFRVTEYFVQALTAFWSRNPSDYDLRKLIARLCIFCDYRALSIAMQTLRRLKCESELLCGHLENLGWWRAWADGQLPKGKSTEENASSLVRPNWAEAVDKFAQMTLPPVSQDFATYIQKHSNVRNQTVFSWDLNPSVIMHIYSDFNLGRKVAVQLPEVEAKRIFLSAVSAIVKILGSYKKEMGFCGTPSEFDEWALRGSASFLSKFPDTGNDLIWQKLVDLGPDAYYWLAVFITNFIIEGSRSAHPEAFIQMWQRIFDYIVEKDEWSFDSRLNNRWRHLSDSWMKVIGLDDVILLSSWKNELVVDRMWSRVTLWAKNSSHISECRLQFLRWAILPVASKFRFQALELLEHSFRDKFDCKRMRAKEMDALADFLASVIDGDLDQVKRDKKVMSNLKAMLSELTNRQHLIGLMLSDRLTARL